MENRTRYYSAKPRYALQMGNPLYAMELKHSETVRKGTKYPMSLSDSLTDPYGIKTIQAFSPTKVSLSSQQDDSCPFKQKATQSNNSLALTHIPQLKSGKNNNNLVKIGKVF